MSQYAPPSFGSFSMAGKVCIVTGAASGIGKSIAKLLQDKGARLYMLDVNWSALASTAQELNARYFGNSAAPQDSTAETGTSSDTPYSSTASQIRQAIPIHCDITSEAAVTHAFATVLASAGALHVLVNNAGIGSVGSVAETTLGELNSLYDVNVKGTFLCLRAAVKAMLHNGDRKHVAQGGGGSDGALPQPWLSAARGGGADSPATEAHSHPPSTPLMQRAVSAPTEGTTMVSSTSPEAIKPSPDAGTDTAAAQGKMRLSAAAAAAGTAGTPAWGTAPSQGAPAVHKTNPIYPPSPSLKGGVCINVSSITAQVGMSERFAYSVSSGAIAAMTRSVAADYAAHGIRCNTVLPGRVHTKFMDEYLAQVCPGEEAAQLARLGSYHPLGRMAEPKEVAALVLYLVSDEAAFVTGCEYNLDGGAAAIRQ